MIKLFIIAFLSAFSVTKFEGEKVVEHAIKVKHPGISLTDSVTQVLYQEIGEKGKADRFYMIVKTVVCGDKQCRVDDIKIYLDALGFYEKIVLPATVKLEKEEGKNFTKEDYEKLNEILADKNSGLKNVYKEQVTGSETSEGVDAISGATIILNTNAYVKGAVWTCYTLWHWANGGVYDIIRNITGDEMKLATLQGLMTCKEKEKQVFGLEQIARRNNYEAETINLVLGLTSADDILLRGKVMDYLEKAPTEVYFTSVKKLLASDDHALRAASLSSILNLNKPLPNGFAESLSGKYAGAKDFKELDLLFKIMDKEKGISTNTIDNLMQLLASETFINARRAYYFLNSQQLSAAQAKTLSTFKEKNLEKL